MKSEKIFQLGEIIKWANGKLINGDPDIFLQGISIDSRTLKAGELFVAICGDKFNGHDYLPQVQAAHAGAVLVNKAWVDAHTDQIPIFSCSIVAVNDTEQALLDIAKGHRQKFKIPVIAITGSNGKTATKEMIAQVLGAQFKVLKSKASFNNHIGVPLTLLELNSDYDIGVFEIGMNHSGEIRNLSSIIDPNIAIITNASAAHLEFFDSVSDIIKAKCELIENPARLELVISNADFEELFTAVKKYVPQALGVGIKNKCFFQATNIINQKEGVVFTLNEKEIFQLSLLGEHNVYNALCAIAVADHFKIDRKHLFDRLKEVRPGKMRMEIIMLSGLEIIADCYNANPHSVFMAIKTLGSLKHKKRRIIVLGEMLELGKQSNVLHAKIGEQVAENKIHKLIAIGAKSEYIAQGAISSGMDRNHVYICEHNKAASDILSKILEKEDVVLLKGSRRVHLEEIIINLKEQNREW